MKMRATLVRALRFQIEHALFEPREPIITVARVIQLGCGPLIGFRNQPGIDQALDRAIERRGP